jgi:hypothetical protein
MVESGCPLLRVQLDRFGRHFQAVAATLGGWPNVKWPFKASSNWHLAIPKAKKSAGANLLTLDLLGSPTWTRTRDLRINSPSLYQLSYQGTASNYSEFSHCF